MLKKIILFLFSFICLTASAESPNYNWVRSPYLGGMLGASFTNYSAGNLGLNSVGSIGNSGVAGRIFFGYDFTPGFGVELGYDQIADTELTTLNNLQGVNGEIREYAIDALLKGMLPIANSGVNLTGRLGFAVVDANSSVSGPAATIELPEESTVQPAFGVGVSYNITPQLPIELSWLHFQQTNDSWIQSTDLVGIGLSYRFY